jgi:hypothetical protein
MSINLGNTRITKIALGPKIIEDITLGANQVFYNEKPYKELALPTGNLLAYWDAGLVSSYSSSNQQTWFDLSGNGYDLTLTGSGAAYFTASEASVYEYSPAIYFDGGAFYESNETNLCSIFNPTASGYLTLTASLCAPGPLYYDNVDYTILFFGTAANTGGGLSIGSKVRMSQTNFPTRRFIESVHDKTNPVGSTGGTITQQMYVSDDFNTWQMLAWSKICSGSDLGTAVTQNVGYLFNNTGSASSTGYGDVGYPSVPRTMKAANNLLVGSGEVTIAKAGSGDAFNWNGWIQAVAIYNRVLKPYELQNAIEYFKYRKLD